MGKASNKKMVINMKDSWLTKNAKNSTERSQKSGGTSYKKDQLELDSGPTTTTHIKQFLHSLHKI